MLPDADSKCLGGPAPSNTGTSQEFRAKLNAEI